VEILFRIESCAETGVFVATWDDPAGGGITTQAATLSELSQQLRDAVQCHFEPEEQPARIRLHFIEDPVLHSV
jgi:predicted RNase H-like HicB family nuclease